MLIDAVVRRTSAFCFRNALDTPHGVAQEELIVVALSFVSDTYAPRSCPQLLQLNRHIRTVVSMYMTQQLYWC